MDKRFVIFFILFINSVFSEQLNHSDVIVGLNKIEQKLEDVPTTDGSYDMPIDALRAAKNNLVPFMNSSIDALIKS